MLATTPQNQVFIIIRCEGCKIILEIKYCNFYQRKGLFSFSRKILDVLNAQNHESQL